MNLFFFFPFLSCPIVNIKHSIQHGIINVLSFSILFKNTSPIKLASYVLRCQCQVLNENFSLAVINHQPYEEETF